MCETEEKYVFVEDWPKKKLAQKSYVIALPRSNQPSLSFQVILSGFNTAWNSGSQKLKEFVRGHPNRFLSGP